MYKLTINNPKSDTEKRISGTIEFKRYGPYSYGVGNLYNLPNPFTNPLSGTVINVDKIGPIESQRLIGVDEISVVQSTLQLLRSEFLIRFGSSIDITITKEEEDKLNDSSENTVNTPSEVESIKITDYIFNVEKANTFTNNELGDLIIIGQNPQDYIFSDDVETIDPEYLESSFEGSDEDPFILPVEDVMEFENELDSGNISPSILEDDTPIQPGTIKGNMRLIAEAAKKVGLTSKYAIYSMIAIASGESGLKPQAEGHVYSFDNVSRVFRGMTADQKRRASMRGLSKQQFFSIVYGEYKPSRVGNRNVSDGGLYYGRGFIQLTGYENYVRYNNLFKRYFPGENGDIIKNPNLLNDATICSKYVALYFLDRVKVSQNSPSYLESALRAVGNDANGGYDKKRKFYNKLLSENNIA